MYLVFVFDKQTLSRYVRVFVERSYCQDVTRNYSFRQGGLSHYNMSEEDFLTR